jgi:hypothetical protein
MSMSSPPPPLGGLQPPEPPRELRGRVLDGARTAYLSESRPDLWSRIWSSRGLRLAWAATVVGLLAANVALSLRSPRTTSRTPLPVVWLADETGGGELAAVAALPAISLDTIDHTSAVPRNGRESDARSVHRGTEGAS